jgi:hypothetical protein
MNSWLVPKIKGTWHWYFILYVIWTKFRHKWLDTVSFMTGFCFMDISPMHICLRGIQSSLHGVDIHCVEDLDVTSGWHILVSLLAGILSPSPWYYHHVIWTKFRHKWLDTVSFMTGFCFMDISPMHSFVSKGLGDSMN